MLGIGTISNIKINGDGLNRFYRDLPSLLLQWFKTFKYLFGPGGESLTSQRIIKDKQITHDNHHDEQKTGTHRFSRLPDDGGPLAPNNLLITIVEPRLRMIVS